MFHKGLSPGETPQATSAVAQGLRRGWPLVKLSGKPSLPAPQSPNPDPTQGKREKKSSLGLLHSYGQPCQNLRGMLHTREVTCPIMSVGLPERAALMASRFFLCDFPGSASPYCKGIKRQAEDTHFHSSELFFRTLSAHRNAESYSILLVYSGY